MSYAGDTKTQEVYLDRNKEITFNFGGGSPVMAKSGSEAVVRQR